MCSCVDVSRWKTRDSKRQMTLLTPHSNHQPMRIANIDGSELRHFTFSVFDCCNCRISVNDFSFFYIDLCYWLPLSFARE